MMRRTVPLSRLGDLIADERGLTIGEVTTRRQRYGTNDIIEVAARPWLDLARDTARDPMIWFLVGTSVLYGVLGEGVEALTLVLAILPLVGMDAYLHRRTRASTEGLSSRLAARATLLRDGYAGAAVMRSGFQVIILEGWYKTLIFIVVAPIMGLVLALILMVAVFWLLRNKAPQRIDVWFRKLQLLSAAAYSLGHGGNDAQKTMGIVASALYGAKYLSASELAGDWGRFHWPIILAAHASIALGTYLGGWRIVHTMGSRITKLKPVGGFCAETAGAITLFSTALAGIPVSTTHTITGAIVGVGATTRLSAVRWGVARRIVWAWVLTIPASAAVAALTFWLIRLIHPGA